MAHVAEARGHCANVLRAKNADRAARGRKQAGDDAQQSAFAGAVLAQQNVELAGSELGGNAAQGCEAPEVAHHVAHGNSRLVLQP